MANMDPWRKGEDWKKTLGINISIDEADLWLREAGKISATLELSAESCDIPEDVAKFACPDGKLRAECTIERSASEGRSGSKGKYLLQVIPVTPNGTPIVRNENGSPSVLLANGTYTGLVQNDHLQRGVGLAICRLLARSILEIRALRHHQREGQTDSPLSTDGGKLLDELRALHDDNNQASRWSAVEYDLERWFSALLDERVELDLTSNALRLKLQRGQDVDRGRASRSKLLCNLDDLGSGVAELMMMLAFMRLHEGQAHLVLIEEPEAHLHPAAVLEFVRIIQEEMPHHQLLICSHSTALVDGTKRDWKLYRARRLQSGGTVIDKLPTDARRLVVLEDLGIRPSQLFLANCTIWVEGPSDAHYIQALLQHVAKTLIPGRDYAFVFYGGASAAHIDLDQNDDDKVVSVLKISPRSAIILDRDCRADEEIRKLAVRLQQCAKKLPPEQVHILNTPGLEIENMIRGDVFLEVLREEAPQRFNSPVRRLVYKSFELTPEDEFDRLMAENARYDDGSELSDEDRRNLRKRLNDLKTTLSSLIARRASTGASVFREDSICWGEDLANWIQRQRTTDGLRRA
ncbi:AAA family ATPase [Sorangium sp. So ce281]|uniref:ATP-dependent nuclease n=1 Tax=unclassified Sorangium TaxID=2621164 RepID=UPI003F5E8A49